MEIIMSLHLMSHTLCPYVQRAVISLTEKNVAFNRTYIDLANKPDWFLKLSPLGKTPVLLDQEAAIFESSAILEYLEDTQSHHLHPSSPLQRARHRGWIEFSSSVLNDIGGFYSAKSIDEFTKTTADLTAKFELLEDELEEGPFFSGTKFSLVDAAFGPVFRYFDVFDDIKDFGILNNKPKLAEWRKSLSARASVSRAVSQDYNAQLHQFLLNRKSLISSIILAENTQR